MFMIIIGAVYRNEHPPFGKGGECHALRFHQMNSPPFMVFGKRQYSAFRLQQNIIYWVGQQPV